MIRLVTVLMLLAGYFKAIAQDKKPMARPDLPGIFQIDLGFNVLRDAPSELEIGNFGSKTVNLYYLYPVNQGKFTINPGFGLSMEKYSFDQDITLNANADSTFAVQIADIFPNASIKKTRLALNYLDIPLEIRWHRKKFDHRSSFKVALGAKFGVLYNAHTKLKIKADGETIKVKDQREFNLNRFHYGAYGRVGIGGFSLFFYHSLSEMFESGKGPQGTDTLPLTFGISITGF